MLTILPVFSPLFRTFSTRLKKSIEKVENRIKYVRTTNTFISENCTTYE